MLYPHYWYCLLTLACAFCTCTASWPLVLAGSTPGRSTPGRVQTAVGQARERLHGLASKVASSSKDPDKARQEVEEVARKLRLDVNAISVASSRGEGVGATASIAVPNGLRHTFKVTLQPTDIGQDMKVTVTSEAQRAGSLVVCVADDTDGATHSKAQEAAYAWLAAAMKVLLTG